MTFIWVMFKILLFAICAGAVVSVIIYVPLTIYVIPYSLWVGGQNQIGKHKDKRKEPFFKTVRNATRLYKAKLSGHEPTF